MEPINAFQDKILKKIRDEHLQPTPRWRFLLTDYAIYTAAVLALVIGGLATSVIIYLLRYNDWDVYEKMSGSLGEFLLLTLPYFWIFFLAVFILIIQYNIRHTQKGYRFQLPFTLGATVLSSLLLGIVFYRAGLGRTIDDVLGAQVPYYEQVFNQHINRWASPESGRLAGMVVALTGSSSFTIVGLDRQPWTVRLDGSFAFPVRVGVPVRMLGESEAPGVFFAHEILPVGPGRGLFRRHEFRPPDMMPVGPDGAPMPRMMPPPEGLERESGEDSDD